MAQTSGFKTGDIVPETGTYKCSFCVMADAFKNMLSGKDFSMDKLQGTKPTQKHYKKGEEFEECPKCKKGSTWDLVTE